MKYIKMVIVALMCISTIALLSACGSDNQSASDQSEYYDYVLCEGDGYSLVVKRVDTVTSSELQYGVIDSSGNWLIPLSTEAPFVYGEVGGIRLSYGMSFPGTDTNSSSEYSDWCHYIKKYTWYEQDTNGSVFIYAPPLADSYYDMNEGYIISRSDCYYHGYLLNVESGEWCDLGEYGSMSEWNFSNGYMIVADRDTDYHDYGDRGEYIKIIGIDGSVSTTDVYCGSPLYIGQYSDGVYFSYDGFYDLGGNKLIDLTEYAGTVKNHPMFSNGKCELIATNPNGVDFTATIDINGNFISEFTQTSD